MLGDDLAADVELMESRNLIRSDGDYQRFCTLYQASFLSFSNSPSRQLIYAKTVHNTQREEILRDEKVMSVILLM